MKKCRRDIELAVEELLVNLQEDLIGNIAMLVYERPLFFTISERRKLLGCIEKDISNELNKFFNNLKKYLKNGEEK